MPHINCVLVLSACLLTSALAQATPSVQTASGPLTGKVEGGLNLFQGIPFAAAPVGDLRFRPPQPVTPWTAPRNAAEFGPQCTQIVIGLFSDTDNGGSVTGQEDCLYLNVYAPASPSPAPRPVMVWIHGGSFTSGAGSLYDARLFAQKHGVVVVTINYRLGPMGFLALEGLSAENDGASGNYGIQDQQFALRWVQQNIAAFGGDPRQVTLAGESAGGHSVCTHLASPASAGLFQKAIIQSGLCGSPGNTVTQAQAEKRNAAFAARLGCRTDVVACLRRADPIKLTKTAVPGVRVLSNLVWAPISGNPTLPRPLLESFESGQFNRVPVMNGSNHDEGRLFVGLATPNGRPISLPLYWGAAGLLTGVKNVSRVLNAYPGRESTALAFSAMFTDAVFSCTALKVNAALSKSVPVYAYEFNDPNALTSLKVPPGLTSLGAFHSSGLIYAFQAALPGLGDPAGFTPAQAQLSDRFSEAWASFVKSGVPTSPTPWRTFDPARQNVQVFTPAGVSESTLFAADHQCGLWSALDLK